MDWPGGKPRRGDIGFVFQEPTLMPWATVFDNVWLPKRLDGVSKQAARDDVEAVLDMVGLGVTFQRLIHASYRAA